MPEDVLRAFIVEESTRIPLRGLAKLVKSSPETVRQFLEHPERNPHRKTLRKFAEYYLKKHPVGYVAEKRAPPFGTPEPLPLLKEVLPGGHDAARADVEKLVELAKRFPDEVPASADRLRQWLAKLLAAEYTGELPRVRPRQRPPPAPRRSSEGGGAGEG